MKKVLLLTAVVLTSVSLSAQKVTKMTMSHANMQNYKNVKTANVENPTKIKGEKLPMLMKKQTEKTSAKVSRRVASDGILYNHPVGTLFGGWNMGVEQDSEEFGRGYGFTTVFVPTMTKLSYKNVSAENVTWSINNNDAQELVVDGNLETSYMRNDKNEAPALYYCPTITAASEKTYTLGEYNFYYKRGLVKTLGLARVDSMNTMYQADPFAAIYYQGNYYVPNQSWGLLSTDNLFGSGTYDDGKGTTIKATGAIQVFDKPVTPLFLTKLVVAGETFTQPIPTGMQLKALITGVKEVERTYTNGTKETVKTADLDNVLATMIANSNDTIDFFSTGTRNNKTIKEGYVIYQKPGTEDILGNIIPGNIVLDDEFAIVLTGFEQDGVDFGVDGLEIEEYNTTLPGASILLENDRTVSYQATLLLNMGLYGMFDMAAAPKYPGFYTFENEELDYRVVRVPAEGSPEEFGLGNCTEGATGAAFLTNSIDDAGYPGVPVFTNVSWFDDNDNANYEILDRPDWIQSVSIDPSLGNGLNIVMFAAEPLPAGETGRWAKVRVVGQEAVMDGTTKYSAYSDEIVILQGDATIADAIIAPKTVKNNISAPAYNLNGQRVADDYKGLVIKNGKKYFNK